MLILMYIWTMITGLQASLLGTLWPVMYLEFDVALSYVGVFSWIGSVLGFVSNLSAGRVLRRFGSSRATAICACIVAVTLLGYALSGQFWLLCLLCIPSSLAGGIIGVAINNYVAVHYHSRHMSWVHCMWGVGSIIGPNVVAWSLRQGYSWNVSYFVVFGAWAAWAVAMIFAQRLWKSDVSGNTGAQTRKPVPLTELMKVRGAKEAVATFFCYNSLEQGLMLWMSSYMVIYSGLAEEMAATYASLFFIGITAGRMLNGFLTAKFNDDMLIRFGQVLIAGGVVLMAIPASQAVTLAGLLMIGFGCAPVCPCLLHSTPLHFGKEHSEALVGVQVAASTLGNCILPSLFGIVANHVSIALLPVYVAACLGIMAVAHYRLVKLTAHK